MKRSLSQISIMLLLALFCGASVYAQKLSPDEQKIVRYIDAHEDEAIALFEKIVNIESPTENLAGVKQVGIVFNNELESIGLTVKWIDMPADMKRAGYLIAETNGTKGKRLLLLGHIDTVLKGEKFRRERNKAYGTGATDMKGGDVTILFALKALHDSGVLKDTRITVMLTGDEESAGLPLKLSRGDMIA